MDEISNSNSISYFHDFTQSERASFEQSLVSVINTISGSRKTTADLSTMKISEDILYAALLFDRLKDASPQASRGFLSELGTRFKRRIERSDSQPLAKALHDTIQTAVNEKSITANKAESLKAEAFAMAQLDKRAGALSRTAKKGGVALFEDKVSSNSQTMTQKNITKYEKFTEKILQPTFLTPEQSRREQNYLTTIIKSMTPIKNVESVETPREKTTSPSSATGGSQDGTSETDKKIDTPNVTDVPTGPGDLVYKADSDKDEFPLLMLPARYANKVRLVEVANAKNELIERIEKFSQGEDGRLYIRLKTKGGKLGEDPWMKVHLTDQSSFDVFLNNGKDGLVERF